MLSLPELPSRTQPPSVNAPSGAKTKRPFGIGSAFKSRSAEFDAEPSLRIRSDRKPQRQRVGAPRQERAAARQVLPVGFFRASAYGIFSSLGSIGFFRASIFSSLDFFELGIFSSLDLFEPRFFRASIFSSSIFSSPSQKGIPRSI